MACTPENKKPSFNPGKINPEETAAAGNEKPGARFLLTWPHMNAAAFGCMLEKEFKYKDLYFNCSLKVFATNADPCDGSGDYYKGPAFPENLAGTLHPELAVISLAFEHGELQEAVLTFKKPLSLAQVQQHFSLPAAGQPLPANIIEITYSYSGNEAAALIDGFSLVGFEHIGAAGLACPGDEDEE